VASGAQPLDLLEARAGVEHLLPPLTAFLEAALDLTASAEAIPQMELIAALAQDAALIARAAMAIRQRGSGGG
jgi:predicted component of type VI protein secretion system